MTSLAIRNGKVFLESGLVEASLLIENGRIAAITKGSFLPSDQVLDATGAIILPGGIDVHTHIEDLDYAYREDYITGTRAAAAGGITTVLEMPLGIEGKSPCEVFDMQLESMNQRSLVDFGIIGAAGRASIPHISSLAERGCIGFKTFMTSAPPEEAELSDLAAENDYSLLKIFSEIAKTGLVASVHAENDAIIKGEITRLQSEGRKDFSAHTESRPPIAENEACLRALILACHTRVSLNLVHMSSKNAFSFIRLAKAREVDVTCEITPHHLFLTSNDGEKIGPWAKVDPPLRSPDHVRAAWNALRTGTIDMVASDHSPYAHHEKSSDNIFQCASGTPGIQTMLPLLIDAYTHRRLTLVQLANLTSTNPAKRFNLYPKKGVIAPGSDADLVLVNPRSQYTLTNQSIISKPALTIFNGRTLTGAIQTTILRGSIIYDNGAFTQKEGYGEFVAPLDLHRKPQMKKSETLQ
ncbi:MAG: dihydroorotase [Theionarchaea archaeon]|nr:dihydroorotase [Theionarchaea archaeon]MBU7000300.1 dihydroorotase [Theionarchaea archaeon]MBU7034875.1 dihydroorotase [Theionarchaea archaeon]